MRVLPVGIAVNLILRDGLHGTVSVVQLWVLVKEQQQTIPGLICSTGRT
jgi:hypothetical protein